MGFVTPKLPGGGTRTLSFPADQWVGNLFLEPESGPGWDPKGVRFLGEWEYLGRAQGPVGAPNDRNIKLMVFLDLTPREAARLRAENPHAYRMLIADGARQRPRTSGGWRLSIRTNVVLALGGFCQYDREVWREASDCWSRVDI